MVGSGGGLAGGRFTARCISFSSVQILIISISSYSIRTCYIQKHIFTFSIEADKKSSN